MRYIIINCQRKHTERIMKIAGTLHKNKADFSSKSTEARSCREAYSKFSSVAQSCPTLSDSMNCSMPGLPVHHQLPEFTQTHVHRFGDVIQPSHPLSSPSPPAPTSPSIRVFSNESALRMRWPKYWSFSFSIIASKEHPGPISFRMDWLDLLAVQGTLKSLLQHHSSKASILWHSAFFTVQLPHPYMTTGKTIALTAAAKSLQSCPTLCDPIDSSPPGSPVPGFLQARTLEWVAISFSNA